MATATVYPIQNTWLYWTQTATTSAVNTTQIWGLWNQGTAATSTNLINTSSAWQYWSTGSGQLNAPYTPAPLTPEQIEQRRVADEARRVEMEAAKAERAEAAARARELLLGVLDKKQKAELVEAGFFHVETKDGQRRYRLRPGYLPVRVKGEDKQQWSYCIHPVSSLPYDDTLAALKLLLDTDEDSFLRIANRSATRVAV